MIVIVMIVIMVMITTTAIMRIVIKVMITTTAIMITTTAKLIITIIIKSSSSRIFGLTCWAVSALCVAGCMHKEKRNSLETKLDSQYNNHLIFPNSFDSLGRICSI